MVNETGTRAVPKTIYPKILPHLSTQSPQKSQAFPLHFALVVLISIHGKDLRTSGSAKSSPSNFQTIRYLLSERRPDWSCQNTPSFHTRQAFVTGLRDSLRYANLLRH